LGCKPGFIPLSYLALFIDAFRHYPEFAKEKDRLIQGELKKIARIINKSIEKGEIRKDINAEFMAMYFFSLASGLTVHLLQDYFPESAIDMLRNQFYELSSFPAENESSFFCAFMDSLFFSHSR
jgi:hypothetical protein